MTILSFICAILAPITLLSPDSLTQASLTLPDSLPLTLTVTHNGVEMLSPSEIGIELEKTPLSAWQLVSDAQLHTETIPAPVYHRDSIVTAYRELTLSCRHLRLILRAYNEGIAYRFVYTGKKDVKVLNEIIRYQFTDDPAGFFPYVRLEGNWNTQFQTSHENYYTRAHLSELRNDHLMFNPVLVDRPRGYKTLLMEADLRHYPGMYLLHDSLSNALVGRFAPIPDSVKQGAVRFFVREDVITRKDYIATISPNQALPWRVVCVSEQDKDLADNNFVYQLSSPCQLKQTDWIRPGKVAWDWWCNWNLTGVNFEAGINTETYKYFIDFASRYGIEYVILDEGWAMPKQNDLLKVVPEIDLEQLVAYGREKNVRLILWAGYCPFVSDMENTVRHYAEMGIAGFKIDFLDRDDQPMVDFVERAAALTARYHMLVDFHGIYKPTGIQRMYPNVLNFEGVFGMEQLRKQKPLDQMNYDVTIPFTRLAAGPADYTQGAMRNGTEATFRFSQMEPMSQGTRCHQLAEYVVFFAPLTMLCDAPTMYEKEDECTRAIASIPTTWDETRILDGKVGEYIVTARRKGDTWYIGALTNWTPRDLTIDLSIINHQSSIINLDIYRDGPNAHRNATDYLHSQSPITNHQSPITVHLAPGGGCLMIVKQSSSTPSLLATKPARVVNLYASAPAESNGYTDQDEWVKDGHKFYQIATPRLDIYYPADMRKPLPVLLSIPGGGYTYVSSGNEGVDVASYFCARGIAVAVLKYRLPNGHENIPLTDACRAMELLRDSAAAWNLQPDHIGVMGFSAGGHLAASLCTKYTSDKSRPNYGILIYPVISSDTTIWHRGSFEQLVGKQATRQQYDAWSIDQCVTPQTPPCLIVACEDDKTVPVENTLRMYQSLRDQHVSAQLLIMPSGGHGWGWRKQIERRDLVDDAVLQFIWANS